MRLGLHALGVGPGAKRAVIEAAAAAAEQRGFATLWAGEHVVMVDEPASRYPYSVDGTIAVPATADWIDPLIALIFAALGVGIGWSREEFDALGVPFERRAARTAEYVTAMRRLWCDDIASFAGEFVSFGQVRLNPKPVHDRRIPRILGGTSD
ncbi:LLM class flavin-dependent oxidoreductase, partial [Mycobacterium sp.]|uniref:LLM class flavin-dependent oxidoreductase n=1 Tax=Mycobacterium sp. TaxID=1785 RepID=UPI00127FAB80